MCCVSKFSVLLAASKLATRKKEQGFAMSRLEEEEVDTFGYHEELMQSNFASPVPLLHGNTASEGVDAADADAEGTEQAFGELLPRCVGFRAACLTFEAERTSGVCPLSMQGARFE